MSEILSDLVTQGDAALVIGDIEQAISLLEQALAIVSSCGNDLSLFTIYQRLGQAYAILNRWAKVATYYEEAAAVARNLDAQFEYTGAVYAHLMSKEVIRDNIFNENPPDQWQENSPFEIVTGGQAILGGYNNAAEKLKQQNVLPPAPASEASGE